MKTLNVKMVTVGEIKNNWGKLPIGKSLQWFMRCNAKGEINWDKAPLYTLGEILKMIATDRKVVVKNKDNQKQTVILDVSGSMS